jgi:hypothetical protein
MFRPLCSAFQTRYVGTCRTGCAWPCFKIVVVEFVVSPSRSTHVGRELKFPNQEIDLVEMAKTAFLLWRHAHFTKWRSGLNETNVLRFKSCNVRLSHQLSKLAPCNDSAGRSRGRGPMLQSDVFQSVYICTLPSRNEKSLA